MKLFIFDGVGNYESATVVVISKSEKDALSSVINCDTWDDYNWTLAYSVETNETEEKIVYVKIYVNNETFTLD